MSEKNCFLIIPIGAPGSDDRIRADKVQKHLVEQVVSKFGYKTIRADNLRNPGIITSQIISLLGNSSLVVADLTNHNPNVFYELAIRHIVRKPVIQLITKEQSIPFDVYDTRTIKYDMNDWDSLEEAKVQISEEIGFIEKQPNEIFYPIADSVHRHIFVDSDSPHEKSIEDLVDVIIELRSAISSMENYLEHIKPIYNI